MRHRLASTAILAAATLTLAAGLTACNGDPSVTTTPDKTTGAAPASSATSSTPKAAPKPKPKPRPAGVGDTITLTDQDGAKIAVTLKKWLTSVHSSNEFLAPDKGKVWVAGQFEVKNVGTKVYDDSPENCVQAADAQGQRYSSNFMSDTITAGPGMPGSVKLPGGGKVLGWIVFEVPKGTKVSEVQYTPSFEISDQTGQWTIK